MIAWSSSEGVSLSLLLLLRIEFQSTFVSFRSFWKANCFLMKNPFRTCELVVFSPFLFVCLCFGWVVGVAVLARVGEEYLGRLGNEVVSFHREFYGRIGGLVRILSKKTSLFLSFSRKRPLLRCILLYIRQ